MRTRNMAVAASLAGSLLMGGCSSDSNTLDLSAVDQSSASVSGGDTEPSASVDNPTNNTIGSVPPREEVPVAPSVSTARIDAQLRDGVLNDIVLGDATAPVTSGSWPQFTPDTSWTWQLLGDTNTEYNVDVYVLDMFQQLEGDVIERLHAQNKHVICYFSAGTYEPWRPDADLFANVPQGNSHYAYTQEIWVDVRSPETAKVMANRMDMAVALGCDGVELDNVDAFSDPNKGLDFDQADELEYQRLLANEAHKRNLAVALKNSVETIPEVAQYFDMAINEACMAWNECGAYQAIIDAGKPVFHVEYDKKYLEDPVEKATMCESSAAINMRTLIMPKALDGSFRISCDG